MDLNYLPINKLTLGGGMERGSWVGNSLNLRYVLRFQIKIIIIMYNNISYSNCKYVYLLNYIFLDAVLIAQSQITMHLYSFVFANYRD